MPNSNYLTPDSPQAFEDFSPINEKHKENLISPVLCPVCKGHGGWNLALNTYPLHGKESTPENRHEFGHFHAFCSQCWGHGFVEQNSLSATCIHEVLGRKKGKSYYEEFCTKCGYVRTVDSSD